MSPNDLQTILKTIRDEVIGVKGSISQDMDRRNELVAAKVIDEVKTILRTEIKTLLVDEIKPLQTQANDNTQDIKFVKRLAKGVVGIAALLGIDKIISVFRSFI